MVERRDTDTQATRHAGGWIVLGGILLIACVSFSAPPEFSTSLTANAHIQLGIDINRAGAAELACIPGVGSSLAKRLIEFRQTQGPFKNLAEIKRVPGVGPKLADQISSAIIPLDAVPDRLVAKPTMPPVNE